MRASRAKVCASNRSSFRLLSVISFTCFGLATIISCPNFCNKRLTQGECVPTSMAIRTRPKEPNASTMPALVVVTCPSRRTSPSLLSRQYRLVLSPRSIPIVTPSCVLFVFTVGFGLFSELLRFFMAGLLFHRECVTGSISHPVEAGLLIPSRIGCGVHAEARTARLILVNAHHLLWQADIPLEWTDFL